MNKKENPTKMARRKFLGGVATTACVLPCLGIQGLMAMAHDSKNILTQEPDQKPEHKFNKTLPDGLTYQEFYDTRFREFITLAKDLEKEMGKEKLIEFLKKRTEKQMFEYGKYQAENTENNTLTNYVAQFKEPFYNDRLTMEIVEESETVFELKVTECIWASAFLKQNAGEIGFASVCHGDYSWPKGFNPKIKMVRDKTLMQGHEYCNHRYILEG